MPRDPVSGALDIDGATRVERNAAPGMTAPEATVEASACDAGRCLWSTTRNGCLSAGFPDAELRPANADTSETDIEFYLGMRSIRVASNATLQGEPFGLDVDGTCTASPGCEGAHSAASCMASTAQATSDGLGCRDNAFAQLMARLSNSGDLAAGVGLNEQTANCELWRGGYNLLARISGYNGTADDASVRVDWYTSPGIERLPSWSCPEPEFRQTRPTWNANARWSVDLEELTEAVSEPGRLPPSEVADPDAFVRDGYLLSRFPDGASLHLARDDDPWHVLAVPVRSAVWLGHLRAGVDSPWTMSGGLMAGRMAADALLRSLQPAGDCEQDGPSESQAELARSVVEAADVLASADADAQRPCDALSFGIAFEAVQVTPGNAVRTLPAPTPCCGAEPCPTQCGDGIVNGDERCDVALPRDQPGACPAACTSRGACETAELVGTGCAARCEVTAITTPESGDGCCPEGATPNTDADCQPMCGDGVVEGAETCDPPETCPSCSSEDRCLRLSMTGAPDSCNVVCHVGVIDECRSEDGCCPARCRYGGDNDCSPRCGDGRVEQGTTETCEPNGPQACPEGCDDGDACTRDIETGSADNCNIRCSHFPITERVAGDACCPAGATERDDSDC